MKKIKNSCAGGLLCYIISMVKIRNKSRVWEAYMGRFLVAGIVQKETIVRVEKIPIEYSGVTVRSNMVFMSTGGDAYNESLALKWLGNFVDLMALVGQEESM